MFVEQRDDESNQEATAHVDHERAVREKHAQPTCHVSVQPQARNGTESAADPNH
jgi:hypothetical protein